VTAVAFWAGWVTTHPTAYLTFAACAAAAALFVWVMAREEHREQAPRHAAPHGRRLDEWDEETLALLPAWAAEDAGGLRALHDGHRSDGWLEYTSNGYPASLLHRYGRAGGDGPAPFEHQAPSRGDAQGRAVRVCAPESRPAARADLTGSLSPRPPEERPGPLSAPPDPGTPGSPGAGSGGLAHPPSRPPVPAGTPAPGPHLMPGAGVDLSPVTTATCPSADTSPKVDSPASVDVPGREPPGRELVEAPPPAGAGAAHPAGDPAGEVAGQPGNNGSERAGLAGRGTLALAPVATPDLPPMSELLRQGLADAADTQRWPELMHGHGFSDASGTFAAILGDPS
jgi:hypothetical protein